jgi:cytochrome c oxidase subunit 1
MPPTSYDLPVTGQAMRRTTAAWLILGLAALVFAGVYSLLLVLSRTPAVQALTPIVDFFHIALVVHVNLSVLIWLLCFAGVFWTLGSRRAMPRWDRLSLTLAVSGTAVVTLSPLLGAARPLMNNYVPILQHPVFYTGLSLFTLGAGSHLLRSLFTSRQHNVLDGAGALRHAIRLSALVTAVAIAAFLASYGGIPDRIEGQAYFELLFWGAGHVIQFTYALLMMVAWVVLASNSGARFGLTPRLTLAFLLLPALPVVAVPFLYLAHDVASPGHRLAFTGLMKYGGLACLPLGAAVLASLRGAPRPAGEARHLRSALLASLVLFATGGALGFAISGQDIVIPAHYHGSYVGVTLAFMGLAYYLLPRLGFGPLPPRLAFWQPVVYGGGQLLHIIGLAWSGGYGVQRKTAGLAQGMDHFGEVASLGLMGFGGLVSVIGGLLFLLVAYLSIRSGTD